jgi:hypothetical protein
MVATARARVRAALTAPRRNRRNGARSGVGGRLCHGNGPAPTRLDHAVMALAPEWSTERQAEAVVGVADTDQPGGAAARVLEVNRHDEAGETR